MENFNQPKSNNIEMPQVDYLLLSNYIINECTKKHYEQYQSFKVPFSYIDFYFEQISRYSIKFNDYMKLFFNKYHEKHSNLKSLINVYNRTFSKATKIELVKNHGNHLIMLRKYFPLSVSFDTKNNKELKQALTILKEIIELIFYNEEVLTLKDQYLMFIKQKIVSELQSENKIEIKSPKMQESRTKRVSTSKTNSKLKNNGSTKITRVIIPKYKLPTDYPISYTISRVDSVNQVNKFIGSVNMINILNNYNINRVTYNHDFVTKRNFIIKPRKKSFSEYF